MNVIIKRQKRSGDKHPQQHLNLYHLWAHGMLTQWGATCNWPYDLSSPGADPPNPESSSDRDSVRQRGGDLRLSLVKLGT